MNKEVIENIFRSSNDSDELFDAFQSAINQNISDVELYKILLGNPALADEEIGMYTEKLCKEFKEKSFELYIWTAGLFETRTYKIECLEKALQYYSSAARIQPDSHIPFVKAINLYNYDIDFNLNKEVLNFIEKSIDPVKKKSAVYKILADHYKKSGDELKHQKYLRLYEKSSAEEDD